MNNRSLLLDELKGLAIIAVIVFHLGYFKWGYLGVDLFLVIAGYLTTASWRKSSEAGFSAVAFVLRRVQRLLPMVAIICTISLLVGYWTMLPDDYENLAQSVIASLGFGNNILCRLCSSDYWAQANDYKPLLHFWYLGVLMQLYVVFACLGKLVTRAANKARWLSWIALTLSLVSAFMWFGKIGDQPVRFYYMPWRFWEFGIGALLCCYGVKIPNGLSLKIPGLAIVGKMSLSIYAWHYVLLAFYRYIVTPQLSIAFLIAYAIVLAALSIATYKFIEQSKSWIVASGKGLWLVTIPCVALIVAFAFHIYSVSGIVRDVPELDIAKGVSGKGIHGKYNERIRKLPRTFPKNGKRNVLVVGNSWGRDWCNILIESGVTNKINLAYYSQDKHEMPIEKAVIEEAEAVFLVGFYEERLPEGLKPNGPKRPYVVGRKWFGYSVWFYDRFTLSFVV